MWPFNRKPKKDFWEIQMEIRESHYPDLQEIADSKLEYLIEQEAIRMFFEKKRKEINWNKQHPDIPFFEIAIPNIITTTITVYPGQRSKFQDESIDEAVYKKMDEIQKEYERSGLY